MISRYWHPRKYFWYTLRKRDASTTHLNAMTNVVRKLSRLHSPPWRYPVFNYTTNSTLINRPVTTDKGLLENDFNVFYFPFFSYLSVSVVLTFSLGTFCLKMVKIFFCSPIFLHFTRLSHLFDHHPKNVLTVDSYCLRHRRNFWDLFGVRTCVSVDVLPPILVPDEPSDVYLNLSGPRKRHTDEGSISDSQVSGHPWGVEGY